MAKIDIELANGTRAGQTLKELTKEARTLNKEIINLKPGTDEFVKKSAELQKVNARIGEVRGQIKGTTEASNELKANFSQYIPFSGTFQKIGQSLGFVQKGVGGLTNGFGLLRGAIISTGIGALVVVLGLLINYLTSTQSGIDKVTSVTRPLQAIFQRLIGVLQELGEKVFKRLQEAIENPKQAFIDLGNVIKDNIINRFEALALFGPAIAKLFKGEFSEGFKALGNATLQLTTGVENMIDKIQDAGEVISDWVKEGVEAGRRLDELQKQIERAEIRQIQRTKQLELIIKQQKAIVEDETRSYEARRQAAENALQAQQQLLNGELSLLDKRIEKMRLEHSLNDTSREQEKELAELLAQRFELQARITEQGIEFNKKINELNKKQAEETLAIERNLQDLRIEVMQEGLDKEIEQINLATERKIEALIGSAEQIAEQEALLEEIRQQQIQAVKDKYAADAAEKDKKAKEEQKQRDEKLAEEQKQIAREKSEFEQMMDDITRDVALDSFSFASDLSGKLAKDEEEAKKIRKAFTVTDIGINLQKELSANAVAAAANPLNAVTAGAAGAAQLARSNFASIARAIIGTARVIAFRKGGVLSGPSHEGGGIPMFDRGGAFYGEAEDDEIVLTKGVYRNPSLRRAASMINVLGGGRSFEAGGPINPLGSSAGGSSIRASQATADQAMMDIEGIKNAFLVYAERVDEWASTLKVVNNVTDTEDALNTINEIRNSADV